jgi:hypothetical protein
VLLDKAWLPLSENHDHHPKKKKKVPSRRCICWYRFQLAGVQNCKILYSVVDLHYDECFSASYSRNRPCLITAGNQVWGLNCHATCGHWKTTIFTSIVYGRDAERLRGVQFSVIVNSCLTSIDDYLPVNYEKTAHLSSVTCWRASEIKRKSNCCVKKDRNSFYL